MILARKPFLSILIFLLTVVTSSSQKVINNPVYGYSTTGNIKIERIELTDTSTTLFFKLTYLPGGWIKFDSTIYLQESGGSKRFNMIGSKGMEVGFNKKWMIPDSGILHYAFIFPKLNPSIQKFDFIGNESQTSKITEIRFTPKRPILQEELMGNWITKDNKGEWLLGLYDSVAIYDNKIWHYEKVIGQNNSWTVILKNANTSTAIHLRSENEGNCFVEVNTNKEVLCSHKIINIDYHKTTPQSASFPSPFFANSYAIVRGFVDGYIPSNTTTSEYVSNVYGSIPKKLELKSDGTFEMKIPIFHPGIYLLKLPLRYLGDSHTENVYLEPNKETVCYFNMKKDFLQPSTVKYIQVATLFMGDNAEVNNELYQYAKKNKNTKEVLASFDSTEEYQLNSFKANELNNKRMDDEWVINHLSTEAINEKTAKIISAQIDNLYCYHLLYYNATREARYRINNHLSFKTNTNLKETSLGFPYLDPVKKALKDTFGLLSNEYMGLLLAIENLPESSKPDYSLLSIMNRMKNNGVKFTNEEQKLYNWFDDIHKLKIDAADSIDYYRPLVNKFKSKYENKIDDIAEKMQSQTPLQYIKSYFDLPDFVMDLMTFRTETSKLNLPLASPLTKSDLKDLHKKFKNIVFADYLEGINKTVGNALVDNEGSVLKSSFDIDPDNLYESITKPYRGKVIFLDFWETWCMPCRNGMIQMASLKEELKDSGIAFVCLTSPSSPEDTWKTLAKTIRGDHYRLSSLAYNTFYNRFSVKSIPRYILINKAGVVVNSDLGHKTNDELRKILLKLANE